MDRFVQHTVIAFILMIFAWLPARADERPWPFTVDYEQQFDMPVAAGQTIIERWTFTPHIPHLAATVLFFDYSDGLEIVTFWAQDGAGHRSEFYCAQPARTWAVCVTNNLFAVNHVTVALTVVSEAPAHTSRLRVVAGYREAMHTHVIYGQEEQQYFPMVLGF